VQPLGKDLREFLSLLGKHEVRFLVVGGFALAAHGVPRYTKDIDIWLDASEDNARKVLLALEEFGFASLGLGIQDFTTPDLVIQLGYEPNRIDLLTGLTGVRFDEAYPKRIANMIDGVSIWIIDRASLIANKRAFGRPQDLVDATELEK
jgi:hypothetical protein